jgi:hypothetical protein
MFARVIIGLLSLVGPAEAFPGGAAHPRESVEDTRE